MMSYTSILENSMENTDYINCKILICQQLKACQWFSGKIQRCHRWAPGSIPGWRNRRGFSSGVERSLRMRDVAGSNPASSILIPWLLLPTFTSAYAEVTFNGK